MTLILFLSPAVVAVAVVLWRIQVAASRGRRQEPYEKRAFALAVLIASLSLFGLVVAIVRSFGAFEASSDPSQDVRTITDRVAVAAATTYGCILVPLAVAVSLSVVAARKHRRSALGKSPDVA